MQECDPETLKKHAETSKNPHPISQEFFSTNFNSLGSVDNFPVWVKNVLKNENPENSEKLHP